MMTGKLQDKVAIITGSDSGIGQATAEAFAKEGADVAVTYFHDKDGAEKTKGLVEAQGRRAIVVHLDQRDPGSVAALFAEADKAFGTPYILVNDAGIDSTGKMVDEMSDEEWHDRLESNLSGPFYCCREFIRRRKAAGGKGKIMWTFFGVLFFVLLSNTLNLMNLSSFQIDMVKGAVILAAALFDVLRTRLVQREL